MIADASLSSAFDDLADLFLGGAGSGGSPSSPPSADTPGEPNSSAFELPSPDQQHQSQKPVNVEGLILGHLPLMASLWANQYPRMVAAADNAPIAMIRLDEGTARVELFHPPLRHASSRFTSNGSATHNTTLHALPDRQFPDLAGAISRAAHVASRVILYSSVPADELLFARSPTVRAMAVLTGADDASAVGAYKAIKRLGATEHASADSTPSAHALLFRIAVMGSEEARATAAFHRLADAAKSFLSVPIEFAGHCRQIAGGIPGAILFEGPSAMTTQAVLEALARPVLSEPRSSGSGPTLSLAQRPTLLAAPTCPTEHEAPVIASASPPYASTPSTVFSPSSVEAAALGLVAPFDTPSTPPAIAMPASTTTFNGHPSHAPSAASPQALPGLTPLSIRCPFDRDPILAIDASGIAQVITSAAAGRSAEATQQLLSVAAWLWTSRELLGMVCPALRTDVQPILHLITDRPTDVKRLIDSDLRLHLRVPPTDTTGTLALN